MDTHQLYRHLFVVLLIVIFVVVGVEGVQESRRRRLASVLVLGAATTPGCHQCAAHRRTCIVSVVLCSWVSSRDMWFESVIIAKKDEVENDKEISHSRRRPKVVRIDHCARHFDPERSPNSEEIRVGIGNVLRQYLETERRANIFSI